MMLNLTEDQESFRDSVRRYLDKEYDFARRCNIVADGGYSEEQWRTFANLGWIAAVFDEDTGGLGDSGVHALILMEEFGRHLVVEPLLWTAIVCGRIISGAQVAKEQRDRLIGAIIGGQLHLALALQEADGDHDIKTFSSRAVKQGEGYLLSGRKPAVPNGAIAEKFIVAAKIDDEIGLLLVSRDRSGVEVSNYRTHDGQTAAAVSFQSTPVEKEDILARGDLAEQIIEEAIDRGIAAICAEAVGSMSHLVEATSAYLKMREQYGQPLAKFQALQHRMADMYVDCENARSITFAAAAALDMAAVERSRVASAAKVQVFRAANFVGKQAVQLHGGMGVSEELDIAHHFKRLTMASLLFCDEGYHLRRFAQMERNGPPL